MKSISLYVDRGSWLNRVHPYTKLLYVLAAIVIPLIGGKLWLFPVFMGCSLVLLFTAKSMKQALGLVAFAFTMVIIIFLIQGLTNHANQTVWFEIGSVKFYKEGILVASKIAGNVFNMLLAFAVFILTTSPQELVDEMEKSGVSPKLGYIIISVFQIIPQMMGTKDTITDAQRSRGLETEGKLLTRAKAFLPLISPVVMSSLTNTRERAIALEIRGFGRKQKKTFLNDREKHKGDRAIGVVLVLLIIATIVWRVISCL